MAEEIRIGVDTGGTFTDFVIYVNGKIYLKKIPSTPENPAEAVLEGLKEHLKSNEALSLIHGTTVATNSLLERKGGPLALIATRGFEDVIFIGRQARKNLYSLKGEERIPLLPWKNCFGVGERTAASGLVEKKVSLEELWKILEKIKKRRIPAVAVCLIHSYSNPANEKIISRELKRKKLMASVSSEILPEYREYERATVTAINAYLLPVISRYLADLEQKLAGITLRIMQSNEGHISPLSARREPIRTALSGPAGGVVGAWRLARAAGFKNIISFDMGGTSTDVSLLNGQVRHTGESMIGDFPLRLPAIDIHTVGAGGGSIAYVDSGGSLRVGPQSAGAEPGPACYGKDLLPTVTDANLVLGRLAPEFFLGGKMKIYPERSRKALSRLASAIGKSLPDAAEGVIAVANASMEKAIRVISIERGFDPRNFSLFSFGGAGGMHAAEIASSLKISRIIIPKNAGVLSALGLLLADSVKDYSRSILKTTEKISKKELERLFASLSEKAFQDLRQEGFSEDDIRVLSFLDLRHLGQAYEITIPFQGYSRIVTDFEKAHEKLYSYYHPGQPVEVVNIRVKAVGVVKKIRLKKHLPATTDPQRALVKEQALFFRGKTHGVPVFDRSLLLPQNIIPGPALAADAESTAFIPSGFRAEVDEFLNLILTRKD